MATDALSPPRRASLVGTLLGLAAVAVIGVTILYVGDRQATKTTVQQVNAEIEAVVQRADLEAQWLAQAIREKRAILGMTRYEVEMAKGRPWIVQRGDTLPEPHREKGGVENWLYRLGTGDVSGVLFGMNGQVIYAADAVGRTRYGNAIRQ